MGRRRTRGAVTGPTQVITARIPVVQFELIDYAAQLRGVDRQEIVVRGAVREAGNVITQVLRVIRRRKERERRARVAARKARSHA